MNVKMIGASPLGGTIYSGTLNPAKGMWVGKKMKVKPVGNFVFEPSGKRWHHIKNGEYRHAEPKLPKVKLYSGLDIAGLQFELRKANQRIAELEAAPNGMMQLSNELAEMKRKCVELTVWYGAMPESNGKTNWTAILHRKGECLSTGITVDRSEYPDRVRYEADRMSHLIGELTEEPDILAYDANKHSGYTARKEHL